MKAALALLDQYDGQVTKARELDIVKVNLKI